MKSIRVHKFGGPEVLQLDEVPEPRAGAGQVVVRIQAIGVNPVETYIRAGTYGPRTFPYVPGSDAAGTIESVGDGVTAVKAGDRVYVSGSAEGTYAEKALCADTQVHLLPPDASFAQGAAVAVPYGTAYRALFHRGAVKPGETVLIHGASGGVGIAATQLASAHGAVVIGTASTDRGRQLVTENGAAHVLDHAAAGYLDALMQLTSGKGVDLIIEMLANVNLGIDLTVLAPRGRVVVVGSRGKVEINPRDAMGRDATILAMSLLNASEEDLREIHAALTAALRAKMIRPVVGREFPLADAARAHEAVMSAGAYGKIVLTP